MTHSALQEETHANEHADTPANRTSAPAASTLIEFPTPGRAPKPQWRKDLSERVREIQQRKAQEAAREAEATAQATQGVVLPPVDETVTPAQPAAEATQPALGLVPPAPAPEVNPVVARALEKLERVRQRTSAPPPRVSSGRGRGAANAARVAREDYEVAPEVAQPAPTEQQVRVAEAGRLEQAELRAEAVEQTAQTPQSEAAVEAPRPVNLVVVPSRAETEAVAREKARRHIPVVLDEAYLARREAAEIATEAQAAPATDRRAPLVRRAAGGFVDLLVIAFATTPFAAIIELTNGNWADPRVAGSLGGIVCVLMFLYLMASTALAGRTWGMSLVGLRTVDARTHRAPTTGQCVRRAFGFMLALATAGLGLFYAAFDAQGRALHDLLSGTLTVRE